MAFCTAGCIPVIVMDGVQVWLSPGVTVLAEIVTFETLI